MSYHTENLGTKKVSIKTIQAEIHVSILESKSDFVLFHIKIYLLRIFLIRLLYHIKYHLSISFYRFSIIFFCLTIISTANSKIQYKSTYFFVHIILFILCKKFNIWQIIGKLQKLLTVITVHDIMKTKLYSDCGGFLNWKSIK